MIRGFKLLIQLLSPARLGLIGISLVNGNLRRFTVPEWITLTNPSAEYPNTAQVTQNTVQPTLNFVTSTVATVHCSIGRSADGRPDLLRLFPLALSAL
jgi:hypothetical protein